MSPNYQNIKIVSNWSVMVSPDDNTDSILVTAMYCFFVSRAHYDIRNSMPCSKYTKFAQKSQSALHCWQRD